MSTSVWRYKCIKCTIANYTISAPFINRIAALNQTGAQLTFYYTFYISVHFNEILIDVIFMLYLCFLFELFNPEDAVYCLVLYQLLNTAAWHWIYRVDAERVDLKTQSGDLWEPSMSPTFHIYTVTDQYENILLGVSLLENMLWDAVLLRAPTGYKDILFRCLCEPTTTFLWGWATGQQDSVFVWTDHPIIIIKDNNITRDTKRESCLQHRGSSRYTVHLK